MKKQFTTSILAITNILLFESCAKEEQENKCFFYSTAQVTKIATPSIVSVNQETDLIVSYYLNNGCGKFESLEATSSGSTTTISLKAKYEGCACTDILLGGQTTYKFKAAQAGVYYLKFLQPNNTYLTDTITVN